MFKFHYFESCFFLFFYFTLKKNLKCLITDGSDATHTHVYPLADRGTLDRASYRAVNRESTASGRRRLPVPGPVCATRINGTRNVTVLNPYYERSNNSIWVMRTSSSLSSRNLVRTKKMRQFAQNKITQSQGFFKVVIGI